MELSAQQNLTALRAAVENGDVASTTRIWRGMTSAEQEGILLTLLGMPEGQADRTEPMSSVPEDDQESGLPEVDEQTAIEAEQTELIPKPFEDLRGLTGSGNGAADGARESPDTPIGSTEYWSQWRQRWKWSVLVAVWAMATIFAFNGKFDAFGPAEWVVGTFASVIFSGLLIGTMANFAVALIPPPAPRSRRVS
jgi:hypothetical protein